VREIAGRAYSNNEAVQDAEEIELNSMHTACTCPLLRHKLGFVSRANSRQFCSCASTLSHFMDTRRAMQM
jgi:hypothetical protein